MPEDAKSAQLQRLAAALRANLKRRKAATSRVKVETAGFEAMANEAPPATGHGDSADTDGTERD